MRFLLLLFTLPIFSQTYSAISVTDISYSSAVIKWTTSTSVGTYIKYGLTASYGSTTEAAYAATTAHEWFISGLNSSTLYHYQLCASSGSCDATDRTFTTIARPSGSPEYPTLPTVPTLGAMPTVWGTTTTITACSDIQGAINTAAAADGNANHLIEITSTLDCSFEENSGEGFGGNAMLNFPAKSGANSSGSGWIVIRSSGVLPPEYNRISSDYFTGMPIFRIPPSLSEGSGAPTVGTCTAGQVYWNFLTAGWGLYECTVPASNTYALVAKTDFSGAIPSSCANNNSWYYKTDEIDPSSIFWCGNNKLYRLNMGASNAGGNISFAANAHHYRISGIQFLSVPLASAGKPSYWTNLYNANLTFTGIVFDLYSNTGINNIVIERNYIDVSYPYRLKAVVYSRVTDLVVANNYVVADFNVPTLGDSTGCNPCTTGFVQMAGSSGALIDNNYVESTGILFFGTDDLPAGVDDVKISRNYVKNSDKYIHGRAANTALCGGCFFPSRHIIECKICKRWLIDGNRFDGHFASTNNQGDLFAISSRPGPSRLPISDLWFRNNYAWSIPNLSYIIGHNDAAEQGAATARIAFTNNLVEDIDGERVPTGGSGREGHAFKFRDGVEDAIIENNTVVSACTGYAPFAVMNDFYPNGVLRLHKNIFTGCAVSLPYYYMGRLNVGGGTVGFDAGWPTTAGYSVVDNINYDDGGGLTGTGYPSDNYWPVNLAAVSFADTSVFDYRLKFTSTYAPTGAGAFISDITAAYGEVYNLRALSITSTGATLAYTAPDSATSCTIEYGTSALEGTGTRVTDTSGSRFRTKAITSLSSNTLYYYRVYCGQMSSNSFTTI